MFISDETLRVIHLVARHQSITTAAEQLNKVPSAISYTIKKAEESLGVELFIRKGRYIELSPAGSYFIEHSKNYSWRPGSIKAQHSADSRWY
ncbi:LysR family transcriptional regulator [Escherichia coli]|nr:LysR family transcriptional regulator [Escherichia coli]STI98258.1 LysR family transcriptional regulator [Escherichia coli]